MPNPEFGCMCDVTIRISPAAKARLDRVKRDGETYNDVILRITSTDQWAGFGIADGDASKSRKGITKIHSAMRDSMTTDIAKNR